MLETITIPRLSPADDLFKPSRYWKYWIETLIIFLPQFLTFISINITPFITGKLGYLKPELYCFLICSKFLQSIYILYLTNTFHINCLIIM